MNSLIVNAPVRGTDRWGSGHYGASRGDHKHRGIDFACYPESEVLSIAEGYVSKLGFPYNPDDEKKGGFRYVEVTDRLGYRLRYFYVDPLVVMGQSISRGQILGVSQSLQNPYPGITDHVHFEVKNISGYTSPVEYLEKFNATP